MLEKVVPILAAMVVIVGGIVAALGYFATKSSVEKSQCRMEINIRLVDLNVQLLKAEQTIFNARVTLERFKEMQLGDGDIDVIKTTDILDQAKKDVTTIKEEYLKVESGLSMDPCSPER